MENESNSIKRSSLGIMPLYIHNKKRLTEIEKIIKIYEDEDIPIPIEWINEKKQLLKFFKDKSKDKSIDKVTTTNLDLALRICNIELDITLIDKIIDLVELIEEKGDEVSIKDISQLQAEWKQ